MVDRSPELFRKITFSSYSEFWEGINETTLAEEEGPALVAACRQHCARTKVKENVVNAPTTTSEIEKLKSAHPLAVTQAESQAADLVALWRLFRAACAKDSNFSRPCSKGSRRLPRT